MDGPNVSEQGSEIPLDALKSLTPERIARLSELWITSVQQVIAVASGPEGVAALVRLLGLGAAEEGESLLLEARSAVGEERYRVLSTPQAGGALGALFDGPAAAGRRFRKD